MQIIRHLPDSCDAPNAVAIGNFDGVHLGHRMVVRTMVRAARAARLVPSVLTFEPHPRKFFEPTAPSFRIATLRDKLTLLRSLGVRQVYAPRFDATMASMLAEDFLHHVLGQKLDAKVVVVGENFIFGNKRRGNIAMLKSWGFANKVRVIVVPPVMVGEAACSSSLIREAMMRGDMTTVNALLARQYRLSGSVVRGDGRGGAMGYPTANIAFPTGLLLPANGVYAVNVSISGTEYNGVANLGTRPTFTVDSVPKLEVHLFDTLQDLYGKTLEIFFVHKLRDERKFDSMENLKQQIDEDAALARSILGQVA